MAVVPTNSARIATMMPAAAERFCTNQGQGQAHSRTMAARTSISLPWPGLDLKGGTSSVLAAPVRLWRIENFPDLLGQLGR